MTSRDGLFWNGGKMLALNGVITALKIINLEIKNIWMTGVSDSVAFMSFSISGVG